MSNSNELAMSKKKFQFISTVIGAVGTIASACVTYYNPEHATAIVTCIGLVTTCIIECCAQFVIPDGK